VILFKLIACAKWPFGGRPMKRVEYRFTDHISGAPVYLWEDTRGRYWRRLTHPCTIEEMDDERWKRLDH